MGGVSEIIKRNGIETYDKAEMADLDVKYGEFRVNRWNNKVFAFWYTQERLVAVDFEGGKIEETLYVHFQKRKVKILIKPDSDEFYLNPPGIISERIKRNVVQEKLYEMEYLLQKIRRKISEIYRCLI